MGKKSFTPDFDKHLFTIEIKVMENNIITTITPVEQEKIGYHQVIGAATTCLQNMMWTQSGINIKAYKEWEDEQKKAKPTAQSISKQRQAQ